MTGGTSPGPVGWSLSVLSDGRDRMANWVMVTDAAEQPGDWVRVSNDQGDQMLVEADDLEGVAIAMDTLKGE